MSTELELSFGYKQVWSTHPHINKNKYLQNLYTESLNLNFDFIYQIKGIG